jgi:predicted esterase
MLSKKIGKKISESLFYRLKKQAKAKRKDSEKALEVLLQQPEVDTKRVSIIGHSEGTIIAPRIAIDDSSKVKNIIL